MRKETTEEAFLRSTLNDLSILLNGNIRKALNKSGDQDALTDLCRAQLLCERGKE